MRSPCLQTTGKIFSKWFNGRIEQFHVDPINRLIGGYFVPRTVQEAEKPGCIICEYAVTELVDYLDNNKTEVAIEKALVRLCLKLPKSVKVNKRKRSLTTNVVAHLHFFRACTLPIFCLIVISIDAGWIRVGFF